MEAAPQVSATDFLFADELILDHSSTRQFYDNLLRGLTHKSNNFLAVIQGFSTLILMQDDLDPQTRENAEHIKEAGDNSKRLFERILTAGGCANCTAQLVQLHDFLTLAKSSFDQVCDRNGVNLTMNVPPVATGVTADISRLKEVLLELVSNAAEAAGKGGGEVMIEVLPPGQATPIEQNRVDIFIRNTGSELTPDQLREIWKPFHTTKESHHVGIGLAISGVLANQMGQRLGVQSANNTTTFWLSCQGA
jgi:signal transduction histidine kinase